MTDERNAPDDSAAAGLPDPREFVGVAAKPMSQPQSQQGVAEPSDVMPANLEGAPQHPQFTGGSASQAGFAELAGMAANMVDRDITHYSARQMRRARDVLTRMYAVRRSVRFYPMDHPAVAEGVSLLLGALRGYFEEGVDVYLTFYEGEVLLGEQLLTEESVLFDQLVRDMTGIGVGTLTLHRGIAEDELARVMAILAVDAKTADQAGGIERMVTEAELPHVRIGAVVAVERAGKTEGEPIEAASAAFGSAVSLMREIDRLLRMNRHVSSAKVKGVVHDIGKLTVDLRILNKPGALTPEEWADVRQHPVGGAEMTALLPGVDKSAVVTILEHHMQWDGAGYPSRTPRRKQHLASRIVAVADSYDAMTSRRSYSAARVQDDAMGLLAQSAGTSLDPTLVRLFIQMMGLYPPRSVVRLTGGEVAIVLAPDERDPLRPVVRVIAMGSGEFIDPRDLPLIDYPELSVKGCIDARALNIEVEDYL